jgi:transcriptional regulator with XRE-family HTH domain
VDISADTLGGLLRAWRDRLSPADAGITASRTRRAAGLRREELADLAGLSVDYIVRLEQGRANHPSVQVVGALARALHLNDAERDHLYRTAGLLPPTKSRISTHIPPGVQRLIARLGDNPLAAFTADWSLLSWNPLWSALQGDPNAMPTAQRNLARMIFGDGEIRRYLRPSMSVNGSDQFEAAIVADLRTASSTYPNDPGLRSVIRELRRTSPVFDEHWTRAAVGYHTTDQKTITHPDVGTITLDCDVLTVPGSDLKLVVFSAPTGSPDAEKLEFRRVTRGVAVANPQITA